MDKQEDSYASIVKSTGIFGGSQLFNILIGVLRTKVVAVLLGPNGLGLMSLYQSVVDMLRSFSDLGLSFSSVRDLSAAQASKDPARLSKMLSVFRPLLWFTALLGALLCIAFSRQISLLAFQDEAHVLPICCLSLAVFMTTLSAGQRAVLQGLRRIGDMAKANILGSLFSFLICAVMFWLLGEKAIIPAILLMSFCLLMVSAYYTLRLKLNYLPVGLKEILVKGRSMLRLGFFSMTVGLIASLCNFLMRSWIGQWGSLDDLGCYQATWAITAMSLSAIFTAMAADYYPRLCAICDDNAAISRSVNEQFRISVLISSLVVMLMVVLAGYVIRIFYSSKFLPAVPLLQWQVLGCFLKVMNWPLAYVVLGKAKGWMYLGIESLWYAIYLGAFALLWPDCGLRSAAYAYCLAHIVYTLVVYLLVRRLCQFSIAGYNVRIILIFCTLVLAVFLLSQMAMPQGYRLSLQLFVLLAAIVYLCYEIRQIWSWQDLKAALAKRLKKRQ